MFETDDSAWPIVTVSVQGAPTDEDLRAFLENLDAWLGRGQRFGMLLDMRGASRELNGAQQKIVLEHMRSRADLTGRRLVQAIVHEKAIHRTVYSVMSSIFPLPFPSKPFPEPESARLWLEDKLRSLSGDRFRAI